MKKRILSVFLALVLALSVLHLTVFIAAADTEYTNGSGVAASGITSVYVKWTLYCDGTLFICSDLPNITRYPDIDNDDWAGEIVYTPAPDPDTGAQPAPRYVTGKDYVEHLVVSERIGNISPKLFMQYTALKTVTLYGERSFEFSAFSGCTALKSVTVNSSVYEIGEYAFSGCGNLETFTVNGTVEKICNNAFTRYNANESNDVSLNGFYATAFGSIGDYAFSGCSSLKSVPPIHGSVGTSAFANTGLPDGNPVYIVSGNPATLGYTAFPSGTDLRFTGSSEEFAADYTNHTYTPKYQYIGDNVTWKILDNVLIISGSGKTIDLLSINEQPWVNYPGSLGRDEQRENIRAVVIDGNITFGEHVLEYMNDKIRNPYQVTVNGGSFSGSYVSGGNVFIQGDTVTIAANAPAQGMEFTGWSGTDGLTFRSGSASTSTAQFEMPDRDITLTAQYSAIPITVGAHSLTLDGDIGVNFYVDIPYVTDGAYAEFTVDGNTVTVPVNLNEYCEGDNETLLYKFSCNVSPAQIDTPITGVVYNGSYQSDEFTYSVNDYIEEIRTDESLNANEKLVNLASSIANYGYYSNEYFEYNDSFTPNPIIGLLQQNMAEIGSNDFYGEAYPVITDNDAGVIYYGSSLLLRSKTSVRHYFTLPEGKTINDYTFVASRSGQQQELTPVKSGNLWYVEIANIPSVENGDLINVSVYETGNSDASNSWDYSPMSYVYKSLLKFEQNDPAVSSELRNALVALFLYSGYSYRYFNEA